MRTIFFIVGLFLCVFTFPVELGGMALVFAACVAFTALMGYTVFTRSHKKPAYRAEAEPITTFMGTL